MLNSNPFIDFKSIKTYKYNEWKDTWKTIKKTLFKHIVSGLKKIEILLF